MAPFTQARKVNQDAKYRLELTLWDELLARRELSISLREGRTVEWVVLLAFLGIGDDDFSCAGSCRLCKIDTTGRRES